MCTKIHHPFESPSRWICFLSIVRYRPLVTPRGLWVISNMSAFCIDYWAKSWLKSVCVYQNSSSLWKVLQGAFISSVSWGVGPWWPRGLWVMPNKSAFWIDYWGKSWLIVTVSFEFGFCYSFNVNNNQILVLIQKYFFSFYFQQMKQMMWQMICPNLLTKSKNYFWIYTKIDCCWHWLNNKN